ncbi:peptidylprolyl isomerase [Bacillus benzoevorans]|uniref:Foldase protein PrsA n=1 Tax=Bacillus benzoevorans TaxID=1456 RepID=A0A7X0HQ40_9BACI|nr:foldase protein PrsA [Bacillus benzoevorans]
MKKWILSLSLAAGVLALTACNSSEAVVESDAGKITKDELYEAMKDKYGQATLQELLYEKVLADKYEVSDKELNKKFNEIKTQLGDSFQMALLQYGYKDEAAFKAAVKTSMLQEKAALKSVKVSEKDVKEYYDKEYKPEIKARHILVADEATAKEVKAKLDAGGKFEDLAKEYSTDTGTAAKGGDLGWFGPGKMLPEFEAAAYALEKNAISEPVQSQYGYHIIQLLDKKPKEKFADVKDEMEYQLKLSKIDQASVQKAMDNEMKSANVKINDKDLQGVIQGTDAKSSDKATEEKK